MSEEEKRRGSIRKASSSIYKNYVFYSGSMTSWGIAILQTSASYALLRIAVPNSFSSPPNWDPA
eukprot:6907172-Pyramimonas_sp.AAC.1